MTEHVPTPDATSPVLTIRNLTETPSIVPTLAGWHHQQWRHLAPNRTLEERITLLQRHLQYAAVPTTFVAWVHDQPIGSAALVSHDMDVRPDFTPWLASVYVDPAYRQQGIGSRLVQHVMDETARLGFSQMHLFTEDQVRFYERLGWEKTENLTYRGYSVAVMRYRFTG